MQGSLDLYPEALRASTLATSRSQALGPQSPGTALNSSLPLSQSSPWRPTQSIQPYAGPPAWQMQSQVRPVPGRAAYCTTLAEARISAD
jgi:hypothetical protein